MNNKIPKQNNIRITAQLKLMIDRKKREIETMQEDVDKWQRELDRRIIEMECEGTYG